MKKTILIAFAIFSISVTGFARTDRGIVYTDASQIGITGKIIDTPNPYHRVDTVAYKGFTRSENRQVRSASGLSVAFRSNSETLWIRASYGYRNYGVNTMGIALRGYDLYVKQDGKWLWAAAGCPKLKSEDEPFELISGMDGSEKEFLLYLPIYSELHKLEIGIGEGASISPSENPFRYRIGVFGSSFTQGISASRPGMAWPAQFGRMTGLGMLSLGCSGNCRLQQYFADVLCDANVDAFLFDAFSNPSAELINERLFPFIEKLVKAHPGVPLIFMQTIYRERRNFNCKADSVERKKMEMAEKLMAEACRKYKDVHFIKANATSEDHETSVDGTHPSDNGYTIWANSIKGPVLEILSNYGIR